VAAKDVSTFMSNISQIGLSSMEYIVENKKNM